MYQVISIESVAAGAEALTALVGVIIAFASLLFCARG
jgi:hypothetical protein